MVPKVANLSQPPGSVRERMVYVEEMLSQLRQVARSEQEEMLVYLIEMAYEEAREASRRHP